MASMDRLRAVADQMGAAFIIQHETADILKLAQIPAAFMRKLTDPGRLTPKFRSEGHSAACHFFRKRKGLVVSRTILFFASRSS